MHRRKQQSMETNVLADVQLLANLSDQRRHEALAWGLRPQNVA